MLSPLIQINKVNINAVYKGWGKTRIWNGLIATTSGLHRYWGWPLSAGQRHARRQLNTRAQYPPAKPKPELRQHPLPKT